ncbi:gp37 [Hemileuca sp. nucleopolyhedrovirus]|uniref:Gp37 n=1 Tax=Hemileuca sp. nucleopolyhedrovirus TaxID=1367203 RepID=S5MQ61_9ABAC|nr:gp37 [Hemileuca sp. nucleopolyhedrovirus]AGR56808.1 gp37 [Hemileuca sp. nucleopolyhedrovirus]
MYRPVLFIVTCVCITIVSVKGHGYLSWPAARQYKCYRDNNFWWPDDGTKIPDEACRAAFHSVYLKYNNRSSGAAANAAQYMFQQYYEYAALSGADYENLQHVKTKVVPDYLCAAGAFDRHHTFGDKSGMDLPQTIWRPDILKNNDRVTHVPITMRFCPTVVHEPSYFQVFVSKPDYDYGNRRLTWDDLEQLPLNGASSLEANDYSDEACDHNMIYKIPVLLPWRKEKFVVYVRWQRKDIAGEGFYNCADVIFDQKHTPIVRDEF